jgi:hypothetical protein
MISTVSTRASPSKNRRAVPVCDYTLLYYIIFSIYFSPALATSMCGCEMGVMEERKVVAFGLLHC